MAAADTAQMSLLFFGKPDDYKVMSEETLHDLGLDSLAKSVTEEPKEQLLILRILAQMNPSYEEAVLRQDIFNDLLNLPEKRKELLDLFNRIEYLKDYGSWRKSAEDKPDLWDLMHRMEEIHSYIMAVEELRKTLDDPAIKAEGLVSLKKCIDDIYEEACFAAMKKDIENLRTESSCIQSLTVGINVNSRFEAESLGLISVNSKQFKKSNIVGNFADAIASRDRIRDDTEWDGDMRVIPASISDRESSINMLDRQVTAINLMKNPLFMSRSTLSAVPDGDGSISSSLYLANAASKMTGHIVKKLRTVLSRYTDVSIVTISKLIPELIYYIRFAEYIEKQTKAGMTFCKPSVMRSDKGPYMKAEGFYNLKLIDAVKNADEIVANDLVFDKDHMIYLLTGANRGGKTTLTQAAGQLYVLAQGGIYVPAVNFEYTPVDMIFTHFPADEDKTTDLGRLGEECVRFKEIFTEATSESLILLNETFSTTSFEEGYYIATDAVRALTSRNIRVIYNTHMHKLAVDSQDKEKGISSIVMQTDNGKRSFKAVLMPPEGLSYARDIAEKYGVTYEMLTGGK
jgi:hypothetical protein